MPPISKKGKNMPESPIRKLVPFAETAKQKGNKIYHLNIGQPDIKSPKEALDAVKNNDLEIVSYSHSAGFASYREKLAGYYNGLDIPVHFEDIIVTTGGSEALNFAMCSIADPGDEIIIPEPFYANYNGFASMNGIVVKSVPGSIENNFALPPIEEFEKLISHKTKAIVFSNPANPTGYLYKKEEMDKLAKLVKKHDLFLIADEVYREFTYDGAKHYSVLQQEGIEKNAVLIDSVSKRYSMCGARIGCLITKNRDLLRTVMKFAQARLSPPTFAQIASEGAINTPQSYFDGVIAEYVERRDTLVEALNELKGVRVAKPRGAFYCIAELPVADTEDFAKWMLEHFEYNNETVMVAPAAGFYSTPNTGMNQVRIAYVLNKTDLLRAVVILKEGLKKYLN